MKFAGKFFALSLSTLLLTLALGTQVRDAFAQSRNEAATIRSLQDVEDFIDSLLDSDQGGISSGDHNGHVDAWRRNTHRRADLRWMLCQRIPEGMDSTAEYQRYITCEWSRCKLAVCRAYPTYFRCDEDSIRYWTERVKSDYCQATE